MEEGQLVHLERIQPQVQTNEENSAEISTRKNHVFCKGLGALD
jgi:hypothetical protein